MSKMSQPATTLDVSRRSFLRFPLSVAAGLAILPVTLQARSWKAAATTFIACAGNYSGHLQGVCMDGKGNLYWCFTTTLVKTDGQGNILKQIPVVTHHGAPCYLDGKVYVAVKLSDFNDGKGTADSWIYVYDADELTLIRKQETKQVIYGAGGIAYHNGRFLVIGGLPVGFKTISSTSMTRT